MDINFSIIGLSETWGKPQHIDMQTIPGYIHYYCTRAKNKRGGGTSLYIKSSIPFKSNIDWENKLISGSAQDDFTIFLMK